MLPRDMMTKMVLMIGIFGTDTAVSASLWVGTSQGSVLVILINLAAPGEPRLTQPVMVSPSGITILPLRYLSIIPTCYLSIQTQPATTGSAT